MPPLSFGIIIVTQRQENSKGVNYARTEKMGRPKADKPESINYAIRTDEETERKLFAYCTRNGISRGEAYRKGIELLLEQGKIST